MFRTNLLAAAAALAISATLSVPAAQAHYATQLKQGPDGLYHAKVSDGMFFHATNSDTRVLNCAVEKNVDMERWEVVSRNDDGSPNYGWSTAYMIPIGSTFNIYSGRDGVPAEKAQATLVSVEIGRKGACTVTMSLPAQ